jgi:hypothetical protein
MNPFAKDLYQTWPRYKSIQIYQQSNKSDRVWGERTFYPKNGTVKIYFILFSLMTT